MRFAVAVVSSWLLLTSSCAGDDAASAGVATTPFTIWVFDEPVTFDGQEQPIAGVRVAFDPAGGGERLTKTTEPDGHVTFDGDFARGGASITILSDEHVYVTMLETSPEAARARPNTIGKPASDLVVFPPRLDRNVEARSVGLRGGVIGKRDPNDVVSLAASALPRLGSTQVLESAYALRVPKDRPFFLLGHETKTLVDGAGIVVENELLKSFRIELPPRTEDQLLDLDLAKLPGLPTRSIQVRAEAPVGEGSPFGTGTRAFASIASMDSDLVTGVYARTRTNADGRTFEIDVTVVDTDVAPERLLSQAVVTAADGSQSVRTEQGAMTDGTAWNDFLAPPTIPTPDAPRTLRDPIPLDGFPAGADLVARVYAGGGQLVWLLYGPPGGPRAKAFAIPYRDEIGSADIQVFALSLSARKERVALAPRGELYRFESTFRDVQLRKR